MSHRIDDVVPGSHTEFSPVDAVMLSNEPDELKKMRTDMLLTQALQSPILPQIMLYNFSFNTGAAGIKGIFAPDVILGPRRVINVEDIRPGMANISHTTTRHDYVVISTFKDVVTDVKEVDGGIQVYSNDHVVRHNAEKTWFVQHIWNYSPVVQVGDKDEYVLSEGDAVKGDLLLEINLNPKFPQMELKEYTTKSAAMYNSYAGGCAMYYLSPRLELPRLSGEAIPPMPGAKPEPAPATPEEGAPAPAPGPFIPPMPGQVDVEWEKPKTNDWWIS